MYLCASQIYFEFQMSEAKFVFSCFRQIILTPFDEIEQVGELKLIPKFTKNVIVDLIQEVQDLLLDKPAVRYIDGSVCVVGDIHGNFIDLIRIFARSGYPPKTKYIFLGDYIDRGAMDLDVIIFLFCLKVLYPEHITLLRGNHESPSINRVYGFYSSIMNAYDDEEVWNKFNVAFSYLPIAAIINQKIFCVHGGISPKTISLKKLKGMVLPIVDDPMVTDLTWSDPSDECATFHDNQRGKGFMFGNFAVSQFLHSNGFSMIVRSHECVDGVRYSFGESLITIFSSSNYTGCKNKASYLSIDESNQVTVYMLDALERKEEMLYYDAKKESSITRPILKVKSKHFLFPNFSAAKLVSLRRNSVSSISHPIPMQLSCKSFSTVSSRPILT